MRWILVLALVATQSAAQSCPEAADHTARMDGRSMTLMALGRLDEAQVTLRAALALNPWLKERHLLVESAAKDL